MSLKQSTFINAKTGKRTWPTTDAEGSSDPVMARLDQLEDMLEEVLAILEGADEGIPQHSVQPATLAMHYKYVLNCIQHRIRSCNEIVKETAQLYSCHTLLPLDF